MTVSFGGLPGTRKDGGAQTGNAAYFEGTNIIVYIRGTLDEEGDWWKKRASHRRLPIGQGGVLVNAHYDSYAIPLSDIILPSSDFLAGYLLALGRLTMVWAL